MSKTLSFLLLEGVFAPDFCILSPSDEINNNRYKRERGEKLLFVQIRIYIQNNVVGDALRERGVVKVCVAVVAKD